MSAENPTVAITLRLPSSVLDKLRELARAHDRSLNNLIVLTLLCALPAPGSRRPPPKP